MAFLEWRRFNFFDIVKDVDGGKVAETLADVKVTATSSGNGVLVIGDSVGNLHLISRTFKITSFRGYDRNISLAEMSKELPFLVTIGEDEVGVNPLIKVWNIDKEDKHGHPLCVRISRASLPNRAISTSCLAINNPLTFMAIGFRDGSILLYRGDLRRERSSKHKLIQEGKQSITGLAFRTTDKCTYLFVVTLISVEFYDVTHKDREIKTILDSVGCSSRCSVLMDSVKDTHFMICRDDAIYCYTTDGLGPCYAIDGEKIMLQWFKSYLVIVAKESKNKPQNSTPPPIGSQENKIIEPLHLTLTVLDIQNKFIVFSVQLKEVEAVLAEWGSFYIITGSHSIYQLAEKDLQSKLALLFKKNLYDVSIRIAKNHQYDAEGLIDIFRQYGDHLYSKSDHNGAIEQYIKTIGSLEPSYVIRKFLASHQIDNLTTYLQALHKQGVATADHTTLLLNCYTKLNQVDKLKEFIMTEDRELDFDVEVAINVCRQSSSEDALLLAKKHNLHSWYLKIQIEDNNKYSAALDYVSKLKFSEAVENMNRYGGILLEKAPAETTEFLKKLCTDYKPTNEQNITNGSVSGRVDCAPPEDFIHLFVNNSEALVNFLEYLVQSSNKWGTLIYNTLVEHYLQIWHKLSDTMVRLQYEQKIMRLLESPDSNCDKHHALILCRTVNFRAGLLQLYEENKMYQQILQYHLTQGDYQNVITCCRRFGNQDSSLWIQALWAGARDPNIPPTLLNEILSVIEKDRLLSPLEVIDAVCNWKTVKIGDVRSYLNSILQNELKTADHEQGLITKYTQETSKIRERVKNLQNSPVTFQGSRCSACNNQLELPSVHFLCQHSFHQHCFQSFSEHDNECPACLPKNKQILDVIRSQVQNSDLHETFHSELERAEDGFSLVADYFGRGIFNKFTIISDSSLTRRKSSVVSPKIDAAPPLMKSSYTSQSMDLKLQKPERPKEFGKQKVSLERYSSMLEANLTRDQHTALTPSTDSPETPLTTVISNKQKTPISTKNPFEDEDYPSGSNPFEDDDDDYDKNLNPFSS